VGGQGQGACQRLVEPSLLCGGRSGEQRAGAGTGQNGLPSRGGKGQHGAVSTELAVSDTTQPGSSVMTATHFFAVRGRVARLLPQRAAAEGGVCSVVVPRIPFIPRTSTGPRDRVR
jgi:hypothetical protein